MRHEKQYTNKSASTLKSREVLKPITVISRDPGQQPDKQKKDKQSPHPASQTRLLLCKTLSVTAKNTLERLAS